MLTQIKTACVAMHVIAISASPSNARPWRHHCRRSGLTHAPSRETTGFGHGDARWLAGTAQIETRFRVESPCEQELILAAASKVVLQNEPRIQAFLARPSAAPAPRWMRLAGSAIGRGRSSKRQLWGQKRTLAQICPKHVCVASFWRLRSGSALPWLLSPLLCPWPDR
jgi:hypothetical protein